MDANRFLLGFVFLNGESVQLIYGLVHRSEILSESTLLVNLIHRESKPEFLLGMEVIHRGLDNLVYPMMLDMDSGTARVINILAYLIILVLFSLL